MTLPLLDKKIALITGGTQGLGKAIAKSFLAHGASVYITHRWGSIDDDALIAEFEALHLPPPYIHQSDIGDPDDRGTLIEHITKTSGPLDIFVSNVAFGQLTNHFDELKLNSLELSLKYSSWPIVAIPQVCHQVCGSYPRYVIGVSSDGGDVCHTGYAMVGSAKLAMEALVRHMALMLKSEQVVVNAIRPGFLDTSSSRATFGDDAINLIQDKMPGIFLDCDKVASTVTALCSGLMDAVTGQVITIDEGWSLVSPIEYVLGQIHAK